MTAFSAAFDADPDRDDDRPLSVPAPAMPVTTAARPPARERRERGANFHLIGERGLSRGWKERARDSIAAIRLAAEIEAAERPATREEQQRLIRFTGFGASDLANGIFRRPGEIDFRDGWQEIGAQLEDTVGEADYASLARCTQYAHFTPEFIVRAIWAGLLRLVGAAAAFLSPALERASLRL